MPESAVSSDAVDVEVENVGGIDETRVELEPGVNVLAGRNATNRTSFLRSLTAVLGSDRAALKGDADSGYVSLTIDDRTYTRTLERTGGGVVYGGDPYLDEEEAEIADLFAFLLETNDARRAVALGGDLREIIMRPVDTEAIEAQKERLLAEKRRIDEELEELESVERRLPALEERRTDLETRIEEKRAELEAKREELSKLDVESGDREESSELDERIEELNGVRSTLEDVRFRLETERKSRESTREEYEEVTERYDELAEVATDRLSEIDERVDELRDREHRLNSQITKLQNLIRINEEFVDGEGELLDVLFEHGHEASAGADSPTDRLLEDDHGVCWTCGTEIGRDRIEATLERLREVTQEKRSERSAIKERLDELTDERDDLDRRREERAELERRLERLEEELDERESAIERLEKRRSELEERIDTIESEIETLEEETRDHGERFDLHKEVNRLEFEIGRLEDERGEVAERIAETEARLEDRAELEERYAEIRAELEDLRTKIDRIEREAVEEFNERMDEILDILGYGNVERIWIERTDERSREGRRTETRDAFTLHVIRSTDSGSTYEDAIEHLSESEREVTGLVFALAGYLVHDVHDRLPFILLDSLEALDSDRIAALVEYFEAYAAWIVVALLPEDAAALDDDHRVVTSI